VLAKNVRDVFKENKGKTEINFENKNFNSATKTQLSFYQKNKN